MNAHPSPVLEAAETGTPAQTERKAPPQLRITEQDMARLRAVVDSYGDGAHAATVELLELELDRATVVPQTRIPPDVVTMHARVLVEETATGKEREIVLVYPKEADAGGTKISILAPVGVAILGLRAGDRVDWPLPNGRKTSLRIAKVIYQPEAAGDLHL